MGLGNPGRKYRETRHNVGRVTVERLLESSELIAEGKWQDGQLALAGSGHRRFLALKPETYMNNSGRAVAQVMGRYRLAPGQVVVLHDDIDIPLGDVRVKRGGGSGGHQGVASLMEAMGEQCFTRVRIGVGRPPEGVDPADYVLAEFMESEREQAGGAVARAAEATLGLIAGEYGEKE
ncbi:MAG: aminoacyl-tRNA hydrolase [Actinobacteria bacterium]|nr:aminoacyl-tRNA hydrolase [Actinomycetota bacterium]